MVRKNKKKEGKSKIVVMSGKMIGDIEIFRIRIEKGDEVGEKDIMVWNDNNEEVGRNDSRCKREKMKEGGEKGEKMSIEKGNKEKNEVEDENKKSVDNEKNNVEDSVIGDKEEGERRDRNGDRKRKREIKKIRVEKIEIGKGIVKDEKKSKE